MPRGGGAAFLLLMAWRGAAVAQSAPGSIAGQVRVATDSGRAVAEAEVTLMPDNVTVRTDSAGRYAFRGVAAGAHALRVRRVGFDAATQRVTVLPARTDTLDVALQPGAEMLAEVRIKGRKEMVPARLQEPYMRMARGIGGKYFSRALIDSLHPYDIMSLLPLVPGVHVGRTLEFARCTTGAVLGYAPHVQVYVDGTRLTNYTTTLQGFGFRDALSLVPMSTIQLIEVYPGVAGIPADFLDDACAVIAIWTR